MKDTDKQENSFEDVLNKKIKLRTYLIITLFIFSGATFNLVDVKSLIGIEPKSTYVTEKEYRFDRKNDSADYARDTRDMKYELRQALDSIINKLYKKRKD